MDFGFGLPHAAQSDTAASLATFARAAEELGFHSLWCPDHIVHPAVIDDYPYTPTGAPARRVDVPFLETTTVLSYLCAVTSRIRIGSTVTVLPYRDPVAQAKVWSSIDRLSHGRAIMGVGVGWSRKEFEVLGVPYAERGMITDEYLAVLRELWENDEPVHSGRYVRLDGVYLYPKPVQRPMPVWVGGHSTAAVRRAARFGQAWHVARKSPEYVAAALPLLREELVRNGRSPDEVTVSLKRRLHITDIGLPERDNTYVADGVIATTREVVEDAVHCARLGIGHLTFDFQTSVVDEQLRILRQVAHEVVPAVDEAVGAR
ncbi:LLM class F420-dependent oxidoreductase [Actinophytocola sp.]|uniref:LLM class F420-dependent oxidoreductase n=1 Tax=Actinophytocola sp. TaxID=1872138 RepID=UPI003D6AB6A9